MESKKFDISKLEKLNHPGRLIDINPQYIWDFIEAKNATIIADIGAGTGIFSKEFSKMTPQSQVIALDISPIMIDWMNQQVCPEYPNIKTMMMEESKIPLGDKSIDVVIMINLHHELFDEMDLLRECYRILIPGGKIAICDWKKEETLKGPPMEIRYQPEEVVDQLVKTGFENTKISNFLINNWLVVGEK